MTPTTKSVKSKISAKVPENHLGFNNLEEAVMTKYADLLVLLDRFKDQIIFPEKRNTSK
ncbi:MAG: hypothetical protein ABIN80_29560 [Dyadobacter sp.]|uniref:hypothetical protein n=1 Tax=Dyadobacter sp. TaxID=1914288 RepID=UPI0032631382